MAEDRRANTAINVGSVRVSGLAAPAQGGEIRQAISAGLSERLASADVPTGAPRQLDIGNLKLRLPHGANATDVAHALSRAIARSLRGERS